MFSTSFFLVSALFMIAHATYPGYDQPGQDDVLDTLKSTGVVPEVIPDFAVQVPWAVTFDNDLKVTPGANLTAQQTEKQPVFSIPVHGRGGNKDAYTIAMIDPDAPTPQNKSLGQVAHFIGTDFTAYSETDYDYHGSRGDFVTLKNQTASLVPYLGPGPPAGSDPHRYTLILYRQTSGLGSIEAPEGFPTDFTTTKPRLVFSLTNFVDSVGGLELVAATVYFTGPRETISTSTRRHVRDFSVNF